MAYLFIKNTLKLGTYMSDDVTTTKKYLESSDFNKKGTWPHLIYK